MKLRYYPDTDSLYIDLAERPGTDSRGQPCDVTGAGPQISTVGGRHYCGTYPG